MQYKKIITGFVVQVYEGTKCISQEFVSEEVEREFDGGTGSPIPCQAPEGEVYQMLDMVQPEHA